MRKFKLYHFCPKDHAVNILKNGFNPSINEKMLAVINKGFIGGQHNNDVVSFTSTYTEPFKVAVAVIHATRTRMENMTLELAVIELEVDGKDLVRVFPSLAAIFGIGGEKFTIGQGLEITVNRSKVNELIKAGKAKIISEKKMKKDSRLKTMAENTIKAISGKELTQSRKIKKRLKRHTSDAKKLFKSGLISKKQMNTKVTK